MFSLKEKDHGALTPKTICGIAGNPFLMPIYLALILSEKSRSEQNFTFFSLFQILLFRDCDIIILF
jgi:hypothetical protein